MTYLTLPGLDDLGEEQDQRRDADKNQQSIKDLFHTIPGLRGAECAEQILHPILLGQGEQIVKVGRHVVYFGITLSLSRFMRCIGAWRGDI